MSEEPEPLAYIARKPCGCFVFAGVDTERARDGNAKEIAWAIRKGYIVERVTCAFVRANWRWSCEACAPTTKQEVMQL